MNPVAVNQQQSLVRRLKDACGGSYTPEIRRKFYISGPQWAAAYEGQALFHAPTRAAVGYEQIITLWEMAGDVAADPVIKEATGALKAGGGATNTQDPKEIAAANRELLTLHELIAHRLFQILIGQHRGRVYSIA